MLPAKLLLTLAVFWHTLAFAAGGVNVAQAYRAMFSGNRDTTRAHAIRSAEWQLWLSGGIIIALGIALAGWREYLANPKLWSKAVVVTVWLGATIVLRRLAPTHWQPGSRSLALAACAISAACWLYGAFLGVAKPLANGVVSFAAFLVGFGMVVALCLGTTFRFERRCELARVDTTCRGERIQR